MLPNRWRDCDRGIYLCSGHPGVRGGDIDDRAAADPQADLQERRTIPGGVMEADGESPGRRASARCARRPASRLAAAGCGDGLRRRADRAAPGSVPPRQLERIRASQSEPPGRGAAPSSAGPPARGAPAGRGADQAEGAGAATWDWATGPPGGRAPGLSRPVPARRLRLPGPSRWNRLRSDGLSPGTVTR